MRSTCKRHVDGFSRTDIEFHAPLLHSRHWTPTWILTDSQRLDSTFVYFVFQPYNHRSHSSSFTVGISFILVFFGGGKKSDSNFVQNRQWGSQTSGSGLLLTLWIIHLEGLLDKLSQAVDPIATASVIKETESAISVIKGTSAALCLFLVLIFVITILFLDTFIKHRTQSLHLSYVRFQYGNTVETRARTYANLIKFNSERMRRNGLGIGAKRTITLLISANETAEAYLLYDRQFPTDDFLLSLLPQGQPFVFRTITDALRSLGVFCTSEKILPKRYFRKPYLSCSSYQLETLHWNITNTRHSRSHQAFGITAMQLWGPDLETMAYQLTSYPKVLKGRMESVLQKVCH